MKAPTAVLLTLIMVTCSLSGCFGSETETEDFQIETVWNFEKDPHTWYHLPGGEDAWGNDSRVWEGRNAPHPDTGTHSSHIPKISIKEGPRIIEGIQIPIIAVDMGM